MATTIHLRRVLSRLAPADAASEELLNALPTGKEVKAVITIPRNVKHHRKFFALLNVIFPHQETYPTRESLLNAIKCALGYGETITLPDGRIVLSPGSISFSKMDQNDFNAFYERAVRLITERILPGVDSTDLEREVEEILQGRQAA